MSSPTIPTPRDLLPPLLACLPTAFVSPRPPPALLPLLSPILRQRVQYAGNSTGHDGWLPLLSWDPARASKLAEKVEVLQLEPHPVSGEVEIDDVFGIRYRRLDEETLHARLELDQFDLLPIYIWCETDTQTGGDAPPAWKLAELRALDDTADGTEWHTTIAEADAASTPPHRPNGTHPTIPNPAPPSASSADDDDDDAYWAAYDRSPAPGPTAKPSPPPPQSPFQRDPAPHDPDDAYYARYASVQPAMDAHDPDEAEPDTTETTPPERRSLYPADPAARRERDVVAPRPISPASSEGSAAERLESRVEREAGLARAEAGVRAFIGSEVRNLFRLARSVGLERDEFEEAVRRELEVVAMLEDE